MMRTISQIFTVGLVALVVYCLSPYWAPQDRRLQWAVLLGALGIFIGSYLPSLAYFMKVRSARLLLQYDGWFLRPKRPINMVWYMLVKFLLGSKNKGSLQYQDYLPSYPLPPLKQTCKKYLDSVEPLLAEEEFVKTKGAVEKFLKKDGPRLHFLLRLRALQNRNWLHDWWRDYIYFKQRTPIPFTSNYFATAGICRSTSSQLDRAAMMLHSACMFYWKMLKGEIENQRANDLVPLCYDSFKYLFMSCRVPGEDIDSVTNHINDMPTHVVIIRRGKFYKFDAVQKNGQVQTPLGIRNCLEKIVKMAGDEDDERGICSFTALPRKKWAQVQERLCKKEVNKSTLLAVETANVILSLESYCVPDSDFQALAESLWHGHIHDRWFDKSINVSVCAGANAGSNIEHSLLDAMSPGQHWEYITTDEEYNESGHVIEPFRGHHCFTVDDPVELEWDVDGMEDDLRESKSNLTSLISDSDLVVITTYGKSVPKKCNLSPDGWFQMAIQLTHYRMYKQFVLTYESATTRFYYKGRTETIRPVSTKSVQFCKTFDDSTDPEQIKMLLKEAIKLQHQYKIEAMRGLGVDRHLFGLYCVAKGTNMDPLPDIFTDRAFNLEFLLSTSQTPVRYTDRWKLETSAQFGGFGTTSDDGYGISYLVYDDYVNWSIHSKKSSSRSNSKRFAQNLKKTMEDMKQLYLVTM